MRWILIIFKPSSGGGGGSTLLAYLFLAVVAVVFAFMAWGADKLMRAVDVILRPSAPHYYLAEGTRPAWSNDGARITFEHSGRLYEVNVNGSGLTDVTQMGGDAPVWNEVRQTAKSPNGDFTARLCSGEICMRGESIFSSYRLTYSFGGYYPIFSGRESPYEITWGGSPSSENSWISVLMTDVNCCSSYLLRLENSQSRPEITDVQSLGDGTIAISRSGTVAFRERGQGIIIMNGDGSGRRLLTRDVGCAYLRWSPDERYLLCDSNYPDLGEGRINIIVVNG